LAGLCDETIAVAVPKSPSLGTLGNVRMNNLDAANKKLKLLLNQQHASALTPKIKEADRQRDADFAEIKRTAATAAKSSIAEVAAAGATLLELLRPFWNIGHEPLASQTTQINILMERYNATPAAGAAVTTLRLTDVVNRLSAGNMSLYILYNERLEAMAEAEGPSATSVKQTVVTDYNSFCDVIEQTLDALPSDPLQLLFKEMNDLRRKYIHHLPKDLGEGEHTVVEPIGTQTYTGKPITVVPTVYYRDATPVTAEAEADETALRATDETGSLHATPHQLSVRATTPQTHQLSLGKDFSVTYKNNVKVGTAELTIHGKGAYKGQKTVTFNIARV
jgi:hypothetical protein